MWYMFRIFTKWITLFDNDDMIPLNFFRTWKIDLLIGNIIIIISTL